MKPLRFVGALGGGVMAASFERSGNLDDNRPADGLGLAPGAEVHGYTLIERLGAGGFGEAWLAKNLDGERYALKFPANLDAKTLEALRREVSLYKRLREAMDQTGERPPIVALRQSLLNANPPALVMEYMAGGDLRRFRRERNFQPLSFEESLPIIRDILEALAFAHGQNIVHRDLSPENVLFDETDKCWKLTDFGLGGIRVESELSLQRSGQSARLSEGVAGKLAYMAPEQHTEGQISPAADIYALGVLWGELLLNNTRPGLPATWARKVPLAAVFILEKCLEEVSKNRLKTNELLMDNIFKVLKNEVRDNLNDDIFQFIYKIGGYRIENLIHQSSKNAIYSAIHTRLDRHVAIKVPNPQKDELYRMRFEHEARSMARLRHENICQVLDVYVAEEPGEITHMVMEYIEGERLDLWARNNLDALSIGQLLTIFECIASGLDAAHALDIVHRDIKPSNIIITPQGVAKIIDFGVAFASDDIFTTHAGQAIGTPAFMAPEQARGRAIGPASDQYAFAMTIYKIFTNTIAFQAENNQQLMQMQVSEPPTPPSAHNPCIPLALEKLILKGLAKAPEDRFPSCLAMVEAMKRIFSGYESKPACTLFTSGNGGPNQTILPMPLVEIRKIKNSLMRSSEINSKQLNDNDLQQKNKKLWSFWRKS
jgi:serine/threonine protein kinase